MSVTEVEQLLREIKRGEHTAFQDLHSLLAAPLTRFAWQIIRDHDAAGDIVQNAFVKVFENRRNIRKNLRAYCFSVVGNLARKQLRRLAVHDKWQSLQTTESHAATEAEQAALGEEAWNALLELSLDEREPLLLRFDQDLTVGEIAVALGCPKGTVATRIRRGLDRLRAKLAGNGQFGSLPAGAFGGLLANHRPDSPSMLKIPSWTKLEATLMATTTTKLSVTSGLIAIVLFLLIGGVTAVVIAAGETSDAANTVAAIPSNELKPTALGNEERSSAVEDALANEPLDAGSTPADDQPLDGVEDSTPEPPSEPTDTTEPENHWAQWERLGDEEAWRVAKGSAAFEGRLLDQYGQPITDGKIVITDWSFKREGRRMSIPMYSITVDRDGSFSFVVPLAGRSGDTAAFEIEYTRKGSTDHSRVVAYRAPVSENPKVWQQVEIDLYVGTSTAELQVLSESGQAASSVKVTLTRGPSQEGDSFAELDARLGNDDSATDLANHLDTPVQRVAYTDWRGLVQFEGLPPGRYTAIAEGPMLPQTEAPKTELATTSIIVEEGEILRSGEALTIPDAIEVAFSIKRGDTVETALKLFLIFTAEDGTTARFDTEGKPYPGRYEYHVREDGLVVLRLDAKALQAALKSDYARVKIWGAKKGFHVMEDSELIELKGGLKYDFGDVFAQ